MPTVTNTSNVDVSQLNINIVKSKAAFLQMNAAHQINENELYFVEGDEATTYQFTSGNQGTFNVTPSDTNTPITIDTLVDNPLGVSKGGTGRSNLESGKLIVGNGSGIVNLISKTSSNTANTVVERDASGDFSARTITADLNGNALTASSAEVADTLSTGRTLKVDLSSTNASTAFDGSANVHDIGVDKELGVFNGGTGRNNLTSNATLVGNGTGLVKLISSKNGAYYATSANGEPQFGTLPVGQGGTGVTSLAAGEALIGNNSGVIQTRGIVNNTSKGALGWNSAGSSDASNLRLINVNTLAYWNGAYNGTSSNLSVLSTVTTGTWQATQIGAGYGGTGRTNLTSNATIVGNGSGQVKMITSKNGAYYATSDNAEPTFGTLPVGQGGTGVTTIANIQAGKDSDGNTIKDTYATKTELNNLLSLADAMIFKGTISVAADIPSSHEAGWTYKVIQAGTYVGQECESGDLIICIADGTTANNADWTVVQTNIDGAVTGPSANSVSDGQIAVFNGASARVLKAAGTVGSDSLPIYIDTGIPKVIISLSVGNISIGGEKDTNAGKTITSDSVLYIKTSTNNGISFSTNSTERILIDSSGNLIPATTASANAGYNLGSSSARWKALYLGTENSYGSTSQPVYWNDGVPTAIGGLGISYGGTGYTNTAFTANRLVYTSSQTKMDMASKLYATSDSLAVNKQSITSGYSFEVVGSSLFDDVVLNTNKTLSVGTFITIGGSDNSAKTIASSSDFYINRGASSSFIIQLNGTENARFSAAGHFLPGDNQIYNIGSTELMWNNLYVKEAAFDNNVSIGGSLSVSGTSSLNGAVTIGRTTSANTQIHKINGHLIIEPSYNESNSYNEGVRINRDSNGWANVIVGGTRGTTSGTGATTWLIGTRVTPNDATSTATADSFYISYNGSNTAAMRIQGHTSITSGTGTGLGFSIRPVLYINADVPTSDAYNFSVNGTSYFGGNIDIKQIANTADAISPYIQFSSNNDSTQIYYKFTKAPDSTDNNHGILTIQSKTTSESEIGFMDFQNRYTSYLTSQYAATSSAAGYTAFYPYKDLTGYLGLSGYRWNTIYVGSFAPDLAWENTQNEISLTQGWTDIGITGGMKQSTNSPDILENGTYIIQLVENSVIWSGILSWDKTSYSGNNGNYGEIILHGAGKNIQSDQIYLRTQYGTTDGLKLQISHSSDTNRTIAVNGLQIKMKKIM